MNINEEYDVEILRENNEGDGVTSVNGFIVFVKGALKNEKVKIKIDPGTQPGKTLRLRGKGLPSVHGYGNGTGDIVVNISVYIPKTLSKSEKKMIEELKESDNFKGNETIKKSIFEKFRSYFN